MDGLVWHTASLCDGCYILQNGDGVWFTVSTNIEVDSILSFNDQHLALKERLYNCSYLKSCNGIIGINKRSELIVNGQSVLAFVNSYFFCDQYLLAVTLSSSTEGSKLHLFDLKALISMTKFIDCKECRSVERGSVLIGYERGGTRAWLQMPRGNLETIHLRRFVLSSLKNLLNSKQYKSVIEIMKKHRIDMNLIFDHNPEVFLKEVPNFVNEIDCCELLNIFLGSISNDDTTKTMYSDFYKDDNRKSFQANCRKLDCICEAIEGYIMSLDELRIIKLYTTLLLTYLKRDTPRIAEALTHLHQMSRNVPEGNLLENKWISFISVLLPDSNLFREALSTYDLDLAVTVARNTRQDPKEYMSLISQFRDFSNFSYRCYQIDIYLGFYERALKNIAELENHWQESSELIKQRNLYSHALSIYHNKTIYPEVCGLYATNLFEKGRFTEASVLFRKAQNYARSLECERKLQNWKGIIACAHKMKLSEGELNAMLEKSLTHYEAISKFKHVAELLKFIDFEGNKQKVVESYCKAEAWTNALETTMGCEDLTEAVRKNVFKRFSQLIISIEQWNKLLEEYKERLLLVREAKKSALNAAFERSNSEEDTQSEIFSEASSVLSDISRISSSTSFSCRQKIRIEKKKKILKEGSQYEDSALLNAIKEIIVSIDSRQDELLDLMPVMLELDAVDEARQLQALFSLLISFASKTIPIVWPRYLYPHTLPGPLRELYRNEDGVIRLPEGSQMPPRILFDTEMIPPRMRNIPWQLSVFN